MKKGSQFLTEKHCTKCGVLKPNTVEYFHWDKRLYKGDGGCVSGCIPCKNANKPLLSKIRREKLYAMGIKEHIVQYQKHKDKRLAYAKKPEVVENRKKVVRERYKNNAKQFNDYKKEYRLKYKDKFLIKQREKDRIRINTLTDDYVAGTAAAYLGITRKEVYANPDLLEAYRLLIRMKREAKYNNQHL
jgi:hypothetical protein